MKLVQDNDFNEYIEDFKKLPLKDKYKEVEDELIKIVSSFNDIDKENRLTAIYNRELEDLKKEDFTNDDFAEGVLVYTKMIQELIAEYVIIKEEM